MIQAPALADLDGVQHRFFTRRGGVSSGLFSSLNCGYGSADAAENVRENRRRAALEWRDLSKSDGNGVTAEHKWLYSPQCLTSARSSATRHDCKGTRPLPKWVDAAVL